VRPALAPPAAHLQTPLLTAASTASANTSAAPAACSRSTWAYTRSVVLGSAWPSRLATTWTGTTDDKTAEELAAPQGDAAVIARVVRRPEAEVNLRALLRRSGDSGDLLTSLVELLDLPEDSLALLDGRSTPDQLPHSERLEATSPARAARRQPRQLFGQDAPKALRLLERVSAWGTLAAALVCAAMTALGVAVLATDGTAVDQLGTSGEDWLATLLFAMLAGVLGWLGVSSLRRRRQTRSDGQRLE
jgi:hypothetical protein